MKDYINNMNWADYIIENICIDYDTVTINLSLDGQFKSIICKGFISIRYIGQWDESVISVISVHTDDEFCQESRLVVKKNNSTDVKGGGFKQINDEWFNLRVEFLDGVYIEIVSTQIILENMR